MSTDGEAYGVKYVQALPLSIAAEIWTDIVGRPITMDQTRKVSMENGPPPFFNDAQLRQFISRVTQPPHMASVGEIMHLLPPSISKNFVRRWRIRTINEIRMTRYPDRQMRELRLYKTTQVPARTEQEGKQE